MRAATITRLSLAVLAWSCLAFIIFATLSPIGLRPHFATAHREHLLAFATVSLIFSLLYPRRPIAVLAFIVCAAVMLEMLQIFTVDRHPRVIDLAFKTIGAVCGSLLALVLRRLKTVLDTDYR